MNVLQVVPELNAGGVERTTLEIAEILRAQGHTPHVASAGGRMENELVDLGGVLHRFNVGSKNPLKLRGNTKALVEIIKGCDIDIVHARSRAPAWPAHGAASATNTPFVTTYHGIYNYKSRLKKRYNAVMAKGDIIIANSEFTKTHILKTHDVEEDKIVVIPRGVDMERFDPRKVSGTDINAQKEIWGVRQFKKLILLPGRLTRWKGQLVAIEALAQVSGKCALVLLGDAQGREDYVEELKDKINELGLSDRIIIPGHSDNMPIALAAADIVLSASTEPEAFGRVAAEAQAMRIPVVATAHGGALETVSDGKTGVLVTPDDPKAMAEGIVHVLNWDRYDGFAARKRIVAQFSSDNLKKATLGVYHSLLKR